MIGATLYSQRKNLLDIYQSQDFYLGIHREPFYRVASLTGLELRPVEGTSEVWQFRQPSGGLQGRLIDVTGYLHDKPIEFGGDGKTYMVTRQDFTLALLFSGNPWRINLNEVRYKELELNPGKFFPSDWPAGLVSRVIRHKWRNILVLNESFLLKQIGLRTSSS